MLWMLFRMPSPPGAPQKSEVSDDEKNGRNESAGYTNT
jgi:hypothetical protein